MLPKIKILYLSLCLIIFSNANSESYVKAGESLIWDSENKSYIANGNVEFKNDRFIAFQILIIGLPGVIFGASIVEFISERYLYLLLGIISILLAFYSSFKSDFG